MASANDNNWQKDAADQNFDYMFKLLIIGNSSVGKTSFLFRYADDSFTSAFVSTVGIDFKVKTVFRQDKRVKLQIWVCLLDAFLLANRLIGLVVRRPPRKREIPGSNPACDRIFSGSSNTSDLRIGTPVATLPGAWQYRVRTGTGQPGVSIL